MRMRWNRSPANPCLLILAGLMGSAAGAHAVEPLQWSVRQAIGYALEHSPDVAVAQSRIAQREEARKEVFSNYLPDLTLDAGYKYLDNVPRIDVSASVESPLPDLPPMKVEGSQEIGAHDNYLAHLNLSQLLFASGRIYHAHRAAEEQVESTRQEVEAVKLGVAEKTAGAYLAVLISEAVAEVQREALAAARAHLEQVQNRYDAGTANRLELLRSMVEVSNVEPRVTEAEQRIEEAMVLLRRAAGLPGDARIRLTDPLRATVEPVDEERELERARAERPEFKVLGYTQAAAEAMALSERGGMLPTMKLISSFGYEKPYFSIVDWEHVFTVGVGIQVPLFDGMEAYRRMRKARAEAETVSLAALQTHADVRTQVGTAVLALREAAVRIGSTGENQERAVQILEISEHSYAAGAATNVEVIDAQLAATRARMEHLKALYDYRSAQIRLAAATGALTAIGR